MKKVLVLTAIASACVSLVALASVFGNSNVKPMPKPALEQTEPMKSAYTDPNNIVQVTPTDSTVTIKIKSNATTGYSWFLTDYNSALLTPVFSKYVAPTSNLVGAAGYVEWQFSVNKAAFAVPQLTQVSMQYIRPWVVSTNNQKMNFTIAIEPQSGK